MDLKKGIDIAVYEVVKYIKEIAIPVNDKIAQVATISANNDEEIGNLIANAVKQVGTDGIITIEEAKGTETYVQVNEGIQFNTGFLSPYFITDKDKSTCVLENPKVLLYNSKMTSLKEFYTVLEQIMSNKGSVLIIAEDFDSEVLDTLVLNKIKAGFKVCAVKVPRLNKEDIITDIAVITDSYVLNDTFSVISTQYLGSAEKIIIDKHHTTIINGSASKLNFHIKKLKEQGQEERAAKLQGGIATLYVGANSEVELKEKKDRIEDAVCATKAAIEEGIVAGGGSVYIKAMWKLCKLEYSNDIKIGIKIIQDAIYQPLKQICKNAGASGEVALNEILKNSHIINYGYNAKTETYGDLIEMGVIDPAKAVRVALENAASVAGLFLTTECVIVDDLD